MTGGALVHSLGRYILVEQSGKMVKWICFSKKPPDERSELAEEIVAHLEKGAPCPEAELDLSSCTDFRKDVYSLVRNIPRGRTMTYGEVAALAGRPGAAVGDFLLAVAMKNLQGWVEKPSQWPMLRGGRPPPRAGWALG